MTDTGPVRGHVEAVVDDGRADGPLSPAGGGGAAGRAVGGPHPAPAGASGPLSGTSVAWDNTGRVGGSNGHAKVTEARGGGARVYIAFLVGAAAAVCLSALVAVFVLVAGIPATAAQAGRAPATLWRMAYTAVLVNLPRAVMIMGPFAMAFVMDTRGLVRRSLLVAAGWAVSFCFLEAPTPGSESTTAFLLLVGCAVCFVPAHFLPLLLVRGLEKREDGSPRTPFMRTASVVIVLFGIVAFLVGVLVPVIFVGYIFVAVSLSAVALRRDTPETTYMDQWYLLILVVLSHSLPRFANEIVEFLTDSLDQTDPLESLATALVLSASIFLAFQLQHAFARRALRADLRAIALFPLQVFEDVFAEFFFANARVYSGGFFVLLAVQITRTLGRDTGAFDEMRRWLGNKWREWHGRPPVSRAEDAVVDWTRIWLQNMTSELTAMFVFVGAIAGEEARGDEIGPLTGLDHGDRLALLGGYGVVFLFEAAAHFVCFAVLRRAVQAKQARLAAYALEGEDRRATVAALRVRGLSIWEEARKLVERHGLYLLATLLAVTLETLQYVRRLRIDYNE